MRRADSFDRPLQHDTLLRSSLGLGEKYRDRPGTSGKNARACFRVERELAEDWLNRKRSSRTSG